MAAFTLSIGLPPLAASSDLSPVPATDFFRQMAIYDSVDSSPEMKGAAALEIGKHLGTKVCRERGSFLTAIQFFLAASQLGRSDALNTLSQVVRSKKGRDRTLAVQDLYDYQDWIGAKGAVPQAATDLKAVQAEVGREEGKLLGHHDQITSMAFSPDGRMLASSSLDRTSKLWDLISFVCQNTLGDRAAPVASVVFSSDGRTVASLDTGATIQVRKVPEGDSIRTFDAAGNQVKCVALSPDGQLVATGNADNTVTLWGVASPSRRDSLIGHSGSVNALAFSPDGKTLASGSSDDTIRLWDPAIDQCDNVLTGQNGEVLGLAYRADGKVVASYSGEGIIRFWPSGQVTIPGGKIQGIDWTAQGLVAISKDENGGIQLWQVADKKCQPILKVDVKGVACARVSPDGQTLALALNDDSISLRTLIGCFPPPTSLKPGSVSR